MGERKGTNHYYPPDFDPKKHGSLNGYHGTHALRERAKKIKEGILIIRFEMPYNIWCGGCEKHIGMGVRYNAEKSKVGMYYTTPIYKFRMKCHMCDNYFEIQTDPQNFTYVIVTGARRKEERWNQEDNEQIVTEERDTVKRLVNDPMFKLEHDHTDKQKIKKAKPSLGSIEDMQLGKRDDYILNKLARNQFRNAKNQKKAIESTDQVLLDKSSLDIKLLKEHDDDIRLAGLMKYKNIQSSEERQKLTRDEIMHRPIFSTTSSPRSGSASTPLHSTPIGVSITPLCKSIVKLKSTLTPVSSNNSSVTSPMSASDADLSTQFRNSPSSTDIDRNVLTEEDTVSVQLKEHNIIDPLKLSTETKLGYDYGGVELEDSVDETEVNIKSGGLGALGCYDSSSASASASDNDENSLDGDMR